MSAFGVELMTVSLKLGKGKCFSWRKSLSYRNLSIDFQSKYIDWFLYDSDLRNEKVKIRETQETRHLYKHPDCQK